MQYIQKERIKRANKNIRIIEITDYVHLNDQTEYI